MEENESSHQERPEKQRKLARKKERGRKRGNTATEKKYGETKKTERTGSSGRVSSLDSPEKRSFSSEKQNLLVEEKEENGTLINPGKVAWRKRRASNTWCVC